jgi:imidazolonepropionase
MSTLLAIVNCSQLITLNGPSRPRIGNEMHKLSIVKDGAMIINNGEIEKVGTRNDVEPFITEDYKIIDVEGRIVMPGFVDAHTHPVFAGNRVDEYEKRASGTSYQEIAASGGGIKSTVRLTRLATEEELYQAAKRYARWFLRSGTTTIEAKSGYGLSVEDELKILRVIQRLNALGMLQYVPTFLGAHEIPDEYKDSRNEYVDLVIEEMLPRVVRENLADYCDVFCEKNVFDLSESRNILERAKNLGLGLRIHADQLSHYGGALLAAELNTTTADHLEHVDEVDIKALKKSGVQPILLPGSVYALGSSHYPPARQMIDEGLAIVLATDFNPGSSPTTSIPMILSLASTHMKLSPAEAITAVTINAAYSVGRGDRIGSLEKGKLGNFTIHDCSDYRELAYFFGIESAYAVYINGELAYQRERTQYDG